MLAYLINGNEMDRIINRVLLKVSVVDCHSLEVLGIHLGGIPLRVSSKSRCQSIRYLYSRS